MRLFRIPMCFALDSVRWVIVIVGTENRFFAPHGNVTQGVSQPPHHVIGSSSIKKRICDNYQAISKFTLLSNVVGVDAWLS